MKLMKGIFVLFSLHTLIPTVLGDSKWLLIHTKEIDKKANKTNESNGRLPIDLREDGSESLKIENDEESLHAYSKPPDDYTKPSLSKQEIKEKLNSAIAFSLIESTNKALGETHGLNDKLGIVFCQPKSLEAWKKKEGKETGYTKECDGGNSIGNISRIHLEEVTVKNEKEYTKPKIPKTLKEKVKLWDKLEKILKDTKQPWNKYTYTEIPSSFTKEYHASVDLL